MPPNASDASNGDGPRSRTGIATPRGELARIRESQARQSSEVRERIMQAMLGTCGDLGYRNVSVQDVLERYDGYRVQFYRYFANKAECYTAAHEVEIERLCARLLDAGAAESSWLGGLRAALDELGRFACERPAVARGLLIEVHVAGGPALAKREEVFERLSRATDGARRETESRHSPPPVTAPFMVGAIEESVCTALAKGQPESFMLAIPELTQMVLVAYFGDDVASEAPARTRVS